MIVLESCLMKFSMGHERDEHDEHLRVQPANDKTTNSKTNENPTNHRPFSSSCIPFYRQEACSIRQDACPLNLFTYVWVLFEWVTGWSTMVTLSHRWFIMMAFWVADGLSWWPLELRMVWKRSQMVYMTLQPRFVNLCIKCWFTRNFC